MVVPKDKALLHRPGRPLSKETLRALGLISANFAALETHISFFVWCLIGEDQNIGQIVTAQMSFARLLDLLGSLVKHKTSDTDVLHDLEIFIRQIGKSEEQRNLVIHSAWMTGSRWGNVSRLKITAGRKGLKHQYESFSTRQLMEIASSIGEAARRTLLFLGFLEHKRVVTPPRSVVTRPGVRS